MAEENLEAPLPPNDGRISPLVNAVFKTCADSGKQSHTHTSRPYHSVKLKVKSGFGEWLVLCGKSASCL